MKRPRSKLTAVGAQKGAEQIDKGRGGSGRDAAARRATLTAGLRGERRARRKPANHASLCHTLSHVAIKKKTSNATEMYILESLAHNIDVLLPTNKSTAGEHDKGVSAKILF